MPPSLSAYRAKRTCCDRPPSVDRSRLTLNRHNHEYFAAMHTRLIVRRCARVWASSKAPSCDGASSFRFLAARRRGRSRRARSQ
jgi:hypothetical protein